MNYVYFQPKGIKPEFCEEGIILEDDKDYIHHMDEPCKSLISDVRIIPNDRVYYDKKCWSWKVKNGV